MKRGKFIVLDGIDGCGKGTQAELSAEYVFELDKKNHVFLTREPYNSRYYAEIRQLLKNSDNPRTDAERMADLFVKDRKVHTRLIEKILNLGVHVICDRYKYSTLAYQKTQGISLAKLIKMHRGILVPDLAVIIDVPAIIALERIGNDTKRSHKEVFERRNFMLELRRNFLTLPSAMPKEKIVIVYGNRPIAEVFAAIKKEIDKILM